MQVPSIEITAPVRDHTPKGERSVRNRVAILTGATGGLGRVIARALAAQGVRMALVELPGVGVSALATECEALCDSDAKHKALGLEADITDAKQVAMVVDTIAEYFGGIDFVIHCAGMYHKNKLLDTADATFAKLVDVNVKAPFYFSKAALPHLRRSTNPTVISICSIAGLRPVPHEGAYCVTKAAMVMMSNVMFAEHREEGIKCTSFCPGPAHTKMAEGRGFDVDKMLQPVTLADAITTVLSLPRGACIPNLEIVPTQDPLSGAPSRPAIL